ncbi:MAG: sigma-54 dependent transcriptional regulator [Candidatus Alcyoniella australis]|nr:sigma-54 dependent transcriptional regulator [Candidatus Alcyoniella australis]
MGSESDSALVRQALDSSERRCVKQPNMDGAIQALDREPFALLVVDLDHFGSKVDRLLDHLQQRRESVPLLAISSRPENLVSDGLAESEDWIWISRPISTRQLTAAVDRLLSPLRDASAEGLRGDLTAGRPEGIVGNSPALRQVLMLVKRVAGSSSSVLITGESGTGKELVAAAIHWDSPRKSGAFVAVNCAALHENLLESELFGHEKGAFTGAYRRRIGRFEQANGGTLFLDEVGDMSLATQAKLLRVIQLQEFERLGGLQKVRVNVRIIAATNKNLRTRIAQSEFREDLFYRLNVFPIHVPPLRERSEDILPLARSFAARYTHGPGQDVVRLSAQAERMLQCYHWPGNVRELKNVIERAVLVSGGPTVQPADLLLDPGEGAQAAAQTLGARDDQGLPEPGAIEIPADGIDLEQLERRYIVAALIRSRGVQTQAARLLRISPRVMHYKLRKHGLDPQEYR